MKKSRQNANDMFTFFRNSFEHFRYFNKIEQRTELMNLNYVSKLPTCRFKFESQIQSSRFMTV